MKRKFLGMLAFCVALSSAAQFSNSRPTEQQVNDLQQNMQKLMIKIRVKLRKNLSLKESADHIVLIIFHLS